MLISHQHNDQTKAKRQRISHKLEKYPTFPEVCSEHLRCVKWQRHQKRVNNDHVLLTYLEWLWTPHSENVGHVYSISYKQHFQSECSSNTQPWSLLQGIRGLPGELWRLQPPSSGFVLPPAATWAGRGPNLGTWWSWGSVPSLPVLPGWTELPFGLCRKLLWGSFQFLTVFPPHTRFHSQLQQCVTSWLRAKHHPAADKLQLCHNEHEWLWQCWNVKFRRFSNLPEWICCQFSLCQWVFYVFSVFCTFLLEGGSRFSVMLSIYFLFWALEIELGLFSTLQSTDLWCTLKTLVLPEILSSVLILLLIIIFLIWESYKTLQRIMSVMI